MVETISVNEASDTLKKFGVPMSPQKLRAGLEQRVYPFGECVQMGNREFVIYKKLLEDFIEQRNY